MRKMLIVAGAISIALGVFLRSCVHTEDGQTLWERIPDEEIYEVITEEEQTADIRQSGSLQEVETGSVEDPPQAAGPIVELTYEEAQLLMKIAEAEAGNQGAEGMWLVMSVVMNRVESPDFPDTIGEVIFQDHQFSSVSDGNFDNVVILTAEAHEALARIEGGDIADEIIGFEVKTSRELDKYFLEAFEYRDHRFYTKDFTKGD